MIQKTTYRHTKETEFSKLFDTHYKKLFNYAFKMLKEVSTAEELVQESFIKLWENFDKIDTSDRSIESFLIVTLKNKIIDDFRKNKTREKHTHLYTLHSDFKTELDNQWELTQQISVVYESLQKKTSEIFQLSREKGLTYKEISIKNNISIKTVELHISKALIAFRKGLKEYL